jgi:hypothetical protein
VKWLWDEKPTASASCVSSPAERATSNSAAYSRTRVRCAWIVSPVVGPERRRSRGVNSIELYFDGTRWWIASVVWQSESPELPIPDSLLPPAAVPE